MIVVRTIIIVFWTWSLDNSFNHVRKQQKWIETHNDKGNMQLLVYLATKSKRWVG
jgi:hypothetical protein